MTGKGPRPSREPRVAASAGSKQLPDGKREELEELFLKSARVPLLVGYFLGMLEVFIKDLFETAGEGAVVNCKVQLFVWSEKSIVEIGAADGRPNAVRDV